jgi:subtilisin family serine protease
MSSRTLVEFVLLGPTNDRRQLQDSPILGDVWIAFAAKPAKPMDLLITPYKTQAAGPLAVIIAERIAKLKVRRKQGEEAHIAYLQGLVAARLFFREVLRIIVPMTQWWRERNVQDELQRYTPEILSPKIAAILTWAQAGDEDAQAESAAVLANFTALDRYVALAGMILWAGTQEKATVTDGGIGSLMTEIKGPEAIVTELRNLFVDILQDAWLTEAQIWRVSLNRKAMPALAKSVPAVKGDAARSLFNVKCNDITWAVMDSGIDGGHEVFQDEQGQSRIVRAFDFSNIREIVSLDNLNTRTATFKSRLDKLLKGQDRKAALGAEDATQILKALAQDADNDRPIHWELVEKFIEIKPETPPRGGHGTHVAGIIGANSKGMQQASQGRGTIAEHSNDDHASAYADGMCPDIKFYDFRVLAKSVQDTEFAIIAALQYARYLNERQTYISIHGVNLSLSIPHDVRNFACGRTPICNECEQLVESGVVVVAAAGNLGYHSFETQDGSYEGYAAFSITDPGNADSVITVGATHRFRPHTYGVSFFSSRGPTGDGRLKPDLVAPGERIQSCLPDAGWGELDGTSMAAPHVSGAAAMLMGRYSELIGEPQRIKRILCESATDLGRERTFQGHGMLDVLRAFQKI